MEQKPRMQIYWGQINVSICGHQIFNATERHSQKNYNLQQILDYRSVPFFQHSSSP